MATPLQRGPIPDALLRAVYASDQDMYPAPLPYARLRSWVAACPELSISFQRPAGGGDDVVGVIIALPLARAHWERLLSGELKEMDVDAASMFPGPGAEEVGVHVFHVERFRGEGLPERVGGQGEGAERPRFAELGVDEIVTRAALVGGWRVVGLSALTATDAGRKSFERMGFTPTGYKEMFTIPDQASQTLLDSTKAMEVPNNGQETAEGSPKAQMVSIYPGEEIVESGKAA
ncbi:hypothetical protein B0H67DRAFT_674333 [Lasiosphaeris hirsuta]|uniref:Uncharacterized protein n=1 Tax=Lasiosphaeris hirsuta TaxID=260670 RepID=A0AA39ZWF1_9PEZI|nr:hypothetical protein B0H67DRAFT_674333 [Lasiosphaeris hirsuta]